MLSWMRHHAAFFDRPWTRRVMATGTLGLWLAFFGCFTGWADDCLRDPRRARD